MTFKCLSNIKLLKRKLKRFGIPLSKENWQTKQKKSKILSVRERSLKSRKVVNVIRDKPIRTPDIFLDQTRSRISTLNNKAINKFRKIKMTMRLRKTDGRIINQIPKTNSRTGIINKMNSPNFT